MTAANANVSEAVDARSRSLLPGSYCNINLDEELMAQLGMKLTSGAGPLQVGIRIFSSRNFIIYSLYLKNIETLEY